MFKVLCLIFQQTREAEEDINAQHVLMKRVMN